MFSDLHLEEGRYLMHTPPLLAHPNVHTLTLPPPHAPLHPPPNTTGKAKHV